MPPKSDSWIRRFTVTDPRKHKKGFTVYKVTSVVFPKASPEAVTKVVVWKRYNDFKKLHKELQSRHRKLHLKDKFPQFVKAKYFGRFEDEVIEERRQCALALLEFIAEHAPLFTAHVFVKFFESGYTVDSNDELQAAIQPLQPEALFVDSNNGPSDTSPLSVDSSGHASSCRETDDDKEPDVSTRSESEQPMLKLGGTWKFPQVPDSISLSSHSSTDDHTTFTDTDSMLSEVSSPLQSDLQYFDPFHPENQDSVKSPLSEQSTPKFKNSSVQSDNGGSERHNGLVPNAFPSLTGSNSMLELLSESLENSKRNGDKDSVEVKQTLVDIKEEKSSSGDSDSGKQEVQYPCDKEPQPQPVPNEQQDTLSPPLTPSSLVSGSVPDVQQNVNYIFEAAYHISQAQQYEANAEYEKAFSFYKAGIATLLSGVQGDNDSARRQVVREKTGKYLMRAEIIYNKYLSPTIQDDSRWSPNSCMSPQVERNIDVAKLQRPLSELKFFRVLGIVDKVMLVLDTRYPTERCYVMKVLHKSSCPINVSKSSIVPRNVPYMVQMYQYFETDTAVFLLLQHASGGKLWDHVSSYFQTAPLSPSKSPYKNASDFDRNLPNIMKDNAYLGKKLLGRNCDSDTSAKSKELLSSIVTGGNQMLTGSDHSNSYLELIRDYTTSAIKKPFNFLKGGSGEFADTPCEEHDQVKDDQCLVKGGVREIAKDCKEMVLEVDSKTSEPCHLRDGDGSNILDSSTTDDSSPVQQYSAEVGISWRNLEKLDTKDLVENSQKLLESVNETLQKSESISFEKPKEQNNNFESFPHTNHLGEGDGPGTKVDISSHPSVVQCDVKDKSDIPQLLGKGPLVVTVNPLSSKEVDKQQCDNAEGSCRTRTSKIFKKCKSEDLSVSSKKKKERRNSSGRRRSVNSHSRSRLERRYSCDDMFEGRARNASGSFEPSRPVSRLQSMIDIPQPRLPEASIRVWAAELVIAIETLHQLGILCRDLRPDNVLLGEKGHVLLTYMCHWCGIDKVVNNEATESLYVAPEVNGIVDVTDAADWWSFGSLLFELLTGQTVYSCHPGGIQSHTILNIPEYVSVEAGSLLTELLRYHPTERLGSGMNGIENLKAHPFFNGMDWQAIKEAGLHA